jgi:predicted cobalt transporter CbtA
MWLVVEPVIRRALAVEEARGSHHHDEEPIVSRTVQVWGGLVTAVLVGVLFGVVFTVVFARLRQRLPASTELGRSLVLASIGFAVLTLVPAVQIPANPPGAGSPETVNERTLIYVLTLLLGLLGVGAVLAMDRRLHGLATDPIRVALDVLLGVAWLIVLLVVLPDLPDRVPVDVPAGLLWDFRLASLAQLAVMWLVVGVVFGLLVDGRTQRTRRVARSIA